MELYSGCKVLPVDPDPWGGPSLFVARPPGNADNKPRSSAPHFHGTFPVVVAPQQRPRIPSRNFSRSSGVIGSRQCIRRPGPRTPPNRILLKTSSPIACQKSIGRAPNTSGASQFQRFITMNPNAPVATIAIAANFNPLATHLLLISQPPDSRHMRLANAASDEEPHNACARAEYSRSAPSRERCP